MHNLVHMIKRYSLVLILSVVIMSSQGTKHPTAVPMRYSSRYKIFPNKEPLEQTHRSVPQQQIYKLLAKIRSLQDDIRALVDRNDQLEADNHGLLRLEAELETAVAVQETEIVTLADRIELEEAATQNILSYERNLQEVGEKVSLLTQIIANKNQKHGILRFEREKVMHENIKLKEQSNRLHFQEIQIEEKIDQLVQLIDPERTSTFQDDLPQKIEKIIEECRNLEDKITSKENALESIKREGVQAVMAEREKQIQMEFNVKLLKERAGDYQQKTNYFSSCYNEDSIQSVIDDMLLKEHALRKELDEQMQATSALQTEGEQAITAAKKRVTRERNQLQDERRQQQMENEMHQKKRDRAEEDFNRTVSETRPEEEESTAISRQVLQANSSIYQRIKMLESENIQLEMNLNSLNDEVGLLRRELAV